MKKTLLTLALCAASLMGTAFAENSLVVKANKDDGLIHVTGTGTYNELMTALTELGEEWYPSDGIILFGVDENWEQQMSEVVFDSQSQQTTPEVNMLEFANAKFNFNELMTLNPPEGSYGPGMQANYLSADWLDRFPGQLEVSVSEKAIKEWMGTKTPEELRTKVAFPLLDNVAWIAPHEGDVLSLTIFNDEGTLVDDFVFNGVTYTNRDIVLNAGSLREQQIALLYEEGAGSGEWGGGALSLVVLGPDYKPVPEPATGTLSLLALAGLAARRRRK